MKYYLAPMEGITGYIYRNSYEKFFNNIDKYFTPFIVPNTSRSLKTKELRDVLPENNEGINVVPQILTNDPEGFIITARKLQQLGYNEINLNLGCPAGTVVSKNRGSGFLAKREELDLFLNEIFKINDMKISIKTRIGKDSPEDFYGNKPNLDVFRDATTLSVNPICYNGDIFTSSDYNKLIKDFPEVKTVMLGRGILGNPGLINEIKNHITIDKDILKEFHDEILNKYIELYNEDRNALFRMKELWGYMIYIFSDNKKYAKKIKKAEKLNCYNAAVSSLFRDQQIIKGAGLLSN
ncbi:tRNA-dihydrouridine synthase [Clostridium sp. FAM 1755]|uniref:tRNA-dihydrouridine synthase n=1 Tax=Clostridium caseinilyticum TaxID=3350403 RepID=UPI0038F7C6E7